MRPNDFKVEPSASQTGICPFCEGNEGETEPEIYAERIPGSQPDGPGWLTRVVRNRFAALTQDEIVFPAEVTPFNELPASGVHEVIIESPIHDTRLSEFSRPKIQSILQLFQKRIRDLSKDPGISFVQIVRNCGPMAGASLIHPHTQLIGLPFVPDWIEREYRAMLKYQDRYQRSFMQEQIEQARIEPSRIIDENQSYVAFTVFAPRFPFESWILPKQAEHD